MKQGTTLLFGLSGVEVERVVPDGYGGRVVHVRTATDQVPACPDCGVISTSPKGKATSRPRDIPYGEADISVLWHKQRWRCIEAACERATFTDSIPELPPRAGPSCRP